MQRSVAELIAQLKKGRVKSQARVNNIIALILAKSTNGAVFGREGQLIAAVLEDTLEAASQEALENPAPKLKKTEDTTNHQAAAGVLKHIEDQYHKAFNARFECNYGYHVPMLRRLLDKSETVDGLKHYADAWIAAGKGELVHGDTYKNSRIWGDATVKSFAYNLNMIKSHAKPLKAPAVKWVMPEDAKA